MGKTLVAGGTGMVGAAVTEALTKTGSRAVVLARHEPDALPEGAIFVAGDVTNPGEIQRAAHGCDSAVICLSGRSGEFDRVEHLGAIEVINAMVRTGGRRVVLVSGSSTGAAPKWFEAGRAKQKAETYLLNAPIEGVVLQPSWFMESLNRMVRDNAISFFGRQPNPIHWLALEDFAAIVVKALALDAARGRVLPVYGPQGIPLAVAGKMYTDATGLENGVRPTPMWIGRLFAAMSRDLGPAVQLMRVFETFRETADLTDSHRTLGAPETTLENWLATRPEL